MNFIPSNLVMQLRNFFWYLLVLAVLGACQSSESEKLYTASEDTIVKIDQGKLVGFRHENGAKVWRNIPYAAPPIGHLRWKAPRPPIAWQGLREAIRNPEWCTQLTGPLDKLYGIEEDQVLGSEDCLYLNIYAPSKHVSGKKIPVMFWIHGGSNTWGRAEEYDGAYLAEQQNVIVVIIQYRLGPLGWFSHPVLHGQTGNELDNAASFALLDLIAGLEWVKANISAFAGDPDNITIFGESAGAHNVQGLIASPHSEGLFQKAIAQSTLPYSIDIEVARTGNERISNGSVTIMADLFENKTVMRSDLLGLKVEEIWRLYQGENNRADLPTMIADGVVLPRGDMQDLIVQALSSRNIPFLFGSTRDEAKFVFAFHDDYTKKQFGLFPKARDISLYTALNEHVNNMWRALGVDGLSEKLVELGVENAYSYRFDWDEEGTYLLSDLSFLIGAAHSLDVPFVFGTFDNFLGRLSKIAFRKNSADARNRLSHQMMSYWAEFAYNGDPGQGRDASLPAWPSFKSEAVLQSLILDTQADGGIRSMSEIQTIDTVLSAVRSDERLQTNDKKCIIAKEIDLYFGRASKKISNFVNEVCLEAR